MYELDRALALLVSTVESMEAIGRNTSAAGVSARMIQRDPAFSVSGVGLPNFRALLGYAQQRGMVHVHKPLGSTDVVVSTRPVAPRDIDVSPSGGGTMLRADHGHGRGRPWLRRDLWRAFTDFSDTPYVYVRSSRSTGPLGNTDLVGTDGQAVPIPSLSPDERRAWCEEFLTGWAPAEARGALRERMPSTEDLQALAELVAEDKPTARRWGSFLRRKVVRRAEEWAVESGILIGDLIEPVWEAGDSAGPEAHLSSAQDAAWKPSGELTDQDVADQAALRQQVLDVLALMPLSELLRLPIPVEYSLRR